MDGKTSLITGSAKRIGRQIAVSQAELGAEVVIHYRSSAEEAESLKEKLISSGTAAWTAQADFETESEYGNFFEEVREKAGNVDYLVNNASIFPGGGLEEMTFEDLTRNIRVNSWAPLSLIRGFADHFSSGKIVNLLDTRVAGYDWEHAAYYLSKVLLARITKMLAIKFAPGYTVNAVAPGLITPPEGLDQSYLGERLDRVPLRRSGEKSDVARAVNFLLSSDFITGQIIYVDGGRNLLHELEG